MINELALKKSGLFKDVIIFCNILFLPKTSIVDVLV